MKDFKFKAGDKVRNIDGTPFSNDMMEVTVERVEWSTSWRNETYEKVVLVETGNTHTDARNLELVVRPSRFEEALQELAKEIALYEEKVNEFSKKVEKLHITMQVMEELNKK